MTEVKKQDILKARSEQEREMIKFKAKVEVARKAVNVTIEEAYANTNKTLNEAKAVQSTIEAVVLKQAQSLEHMKDTVKFDNP